MEKGMILYRSKYGAAKKYADWLAEMTGYECCEAAGAAVDRAEQCEAVVLCGGIYASGIAGLPFLKKNINRLKGKKIAILCVGASPYDDAAFAAIRSHNLKGELQGIPLFYGRGAWDESKMTLKDRTLCRLLQKSVAKKDPGTWEPWMKALMCAVGQAKDWTDKRYLAPLVEFLRG